jgi:hypothetical protein
MQKGGPATVQVVRRWFLSAEPLVQYRVTSCEIRGDWSGIYQRPPEVYDDPGQVAHYHILGHSAGGFISEPALDWSHSTVSSAGHVTRGVCLRNAWLHPLWSGFNFANRSSQSARSTRNVSPPLFISLMPVRSSETISCLKPFLQYSFGGGNTNTNFKFILKCRR